MDEMTNRKRAQEMAGKLLDTMRLAPFSVDVEGYRRRREESLEDLAHRSAESVRDSGRPVTLEAMPAYERRIVHLTLSKDPTVGTASVGEGEHRKVRISVRR